VLCSYQIECSHDPVYIAGRYQKYSRTLSQTAWLIEDEEGKKRVKTSIEEIMGNVLKRELSAKGFLKLNHI
jgi:tRNA pseudouridine synthase 10